MYSSAGGGGALHTFLASPLASKLGCHYQAAENAERRELVPVMKKGFDLGF